MPYQINYTDPSKPPITVLDNSINSSTSVKFPGRGYSDYGAIIAENFLHLLENFSNNIPPANPVEGQLWYDNTDDADQLKLYDGTQWISASGLKKSLTEPTASSSNEGDLWVNSDSQQLFMYVGSKWTLVGPDYSSGLFTGFKAENIVGIDNNTYTVFTLRIQEQVLTIFSLNTFTPKSLINGFGVIRPGINLTSNNGANVVKYYGTSEKAENLIIGNTVVPAANFLRSDQISTTNSRLRILTDRGITIGARSQTTIESDGSSTVLQNSISGANIDVRMKNDIDAFPNLVMRISSSGNVGIGSGTNNLTDKFSVYGNIRIKADNSSELSTATTGKLFIENTTEAEDINSGSIVTFGGIGVAKSVHVGENIFVNGSLSTGNINPISSGKNIGNPVNKYANVYADSFFGSLTGNVTGQLIGRASRADRLTTQRAFSISGDADASAVLFDGSNNVNLIVRIKNTIIADRNETTTANNADEILINKTQGNDLGLYKITKQNFLKSIPVIPIGMISPYAGTIAPSGWLLCDGSEIRQTEYPELFDIVGFLFKPQGEITNIGFFGLPDLRGRFPLGITNMGGTDSNRILLNQQDANAVGKSGGKESTIIEQRNLPDHEHDLKGNAGNQYYAIKEDNGETVDDNAIPLSIPTDSGVAYGIPTSGNILSDTTLNRPLDVLNPFLAVNYIIYTGK
jgi:microcystin-dependent protein